MPFVWDSQFNGVIKLIDIEEIRNKIDYVNSNVQPGCGVDHLTYNTGHNINENTCNTTTQCPATKPDCPTTNSVYESGYNNSYTNSVNEGSYSNSYTNSTNETLYSNSATTSNAITNTTYLSSTGGNCSEGSSNAATNSANDYRVCHSDNKASEDR